MIKINFSQEEITNLQKLALNHDHQFVRAKAFALVMKSQDIQHNKICKSLDICPNTLISYLESYISKGIESITSLNFYKPESAIFEHDEEIKKIFKEKPPFSVKEASLRIFEKTKIKLGKTQTRHHLIRLGLRRRKSVSIPAKANIARQKEFLETELMPRLEEAKNEQRSLYFGDTAHFVLEPYAGYVWSYGRFFVKAPSGRQRHNVLGALNAITRELTTVTNDTYITSTEVCEMLKLLSKQAKLPITVVLDNASYQRCKMVTDLAKELNIELLFLPPYSPNLNLIERIWKFAKKECLQLKYFPKFNEFRDAINEFLSTMHATFKEALTTLLTLNFQIFEAAEIC